MNKSLIKYVENNRVFEKWQTAFILLFPYFFSIHINQYDIPYFKDFVTYARLLLFFVLAYIQIFVRKDKLDGLSIGVIAMEVWITITTFLTNRHIVAVSFEATSILGMCLIVQMFKEHPKSLITASMIMFEITIYPNFLSILRYLGKINGMTIFFLGNYAHLITWFIPAIAVSVLYYKHFGNLKRPAILIATCVVSSFICKCATAMLSILALILIVAFEFVFKKEHKHLLTILFILVIIVDCSMLYIYTTAGTSIFDPVVKLLGKSASFGARNEVWGIAINHVKDHPLIGLGFRTKMPSLTSSYVYGSAHNEILNRALVGGIPSAILFILVNWIVIKKSYVYKKNIYKSVFIACMAAIFVTYMVESYNVIFRFFFVFSLFYYLENYSLDGDKAEE